MNIKRFLDENVGAEINGKDKLFSKPVLIFRKLLHGFYFVIPITSQAKSGTWYVSFKIKDKEMCACLHKVRSIDYRRLSNRLGELEESDYEKIKISLKNLYL